MRLPRAHRRAEATALVVLFGPLLWEWAETSASSSRLSYALLVPLLAVVLAWRRGLGARAPTGMLADQRSADASAIPAIAAAGLLAAGGLTGIFTLSLLAVPTAAVAWAARGGTALVRRHAAALSLLYLMVPPPMPLMDRLNPTLVEWSGRTAVTLLAPFDPDCTWIGSTLGFRGWDLVVADVCSGSGTFLTLGVLSAFLAGLFRLRAGVSALVIALSIALTLVVNGTRIASSALVIDTFGAEAGAGLPHELLGQAVVVAGAALLVLGIERGQRRWRRTEAQA